MNHSKRTIRVLTVDPYSHIVGPHQVLARYVETLSTACDARYEFIVAVPSTGPVHDHYLAMPVTVIVVPGIEYLRRGQGFRKYFTSLMSGFGATVSLRRIIKFNHIDLVHSTTVSCWWGGIAARLTGVPHIFHIHDLTLGSSRVVGLVLGSILLLTADRILCVSQAALAALPGPAKNKTKALVLYNGVDSTRFTPDPNSRGEVLQELHLPPNSFLVSAFGTLDPRKGQDILLRAAATIAPAEPSIQVLIVGPQSLGDSELAYRSSLEKIVADSGLASRVHFLGSRSDVGLLMQATDVVVQPSRIEAGPIVPLEAMATGVPVIVTGVGANVEEVVDGLTGLVVPPEDPAAMSNAIVSLLRSREGRVAMGARARAHVMANFDLGSQAAKLGLIYRELLE